MLGEPTKITCNNSDLRARVLPLLRGQVFHVTKLQTFDSIRTTGSIKNNRDGQFRFTYGQSANSYGRVRGWVSLFDLRNATDAEIDEALLKYYFLNPFFDESTHVYLFISECAWPYLISWERAKQEKAWKEMFIPDVETWYPGDIPISLVSDALVVTVQTREDSLVAQLREAIQNVRKRTS